MKVFLDNKDLYNKLKDVIKTDVTEFNDEFLFDRIEHYFKGKLAWNEIVRGTEIFKEGEFDRLVDVSDKLREAISFNFNTSIGLKLFSKDGMEKMYEHFHSTEKTIPTGIKSFDKLIRGGLHRQSVTVLLAESGKGKTLISCAITANQILRNYKVLYVTLELSETYIGERIMQNILNMDQEDLRSLSKESFLKRCEKIRKKVKDLLFIIKYPAQGLNVNSLRFLMKELKTKQKFEPDIIMLDYLGLFAPANIAVNANSNDKGVTKCQELQAFVHEYDLPIFTGAQSNRSGYGSNYLNPTNIADAIGIFMEADLVVGVTQTEDQRELSTPIYTWQIMKSRFGLDKGIAPVGVIYEKMKLIDLEDENGNNFKNNGNIEKATDEVNGMIKSEKKKKRNSIIEFD